MRFGCFEHKLPLQGRPRFEQRRNFRSDVRGSDWEIVLDDMLCYSEPGEGGRIWPTDECKASWRTIDE